MARKKMEPDVLLNEMEKVAAGNGIDGMENDDESGVLPVDGMVIEDVPVANDTATVELTAPVVQSAENVGTPVTSDMPQEKMPIRRTRAKNGITQPSEAALEKSVTASLATGFYNTDFNETDRDLSPDQRKEWTAIYASFRSKTPLTGEVIGVDVYTLPVVDQETKITTMRQVLCLVIMDYRVKVIIPQTEIWYNETDILPDYVIKRMVGAKLDYVVTHVDRSGECAVASRRLALGYNRNRFYWDKQQNAAGKILTCRLLVVGPKRILAECNGFDISISNRDISYTAIADLREEYRTGQELPVKLISYDPRSGTLEVSAKAVNPNPFDGADRRHPVNCTRRAVVSGSYAGGLFCRLVDDTNCLCRYSPAYFDTEFFIGDAVLIAVTKFDYARKRMYGRILSRG